MSRNDSGLIICPHCMSSDWECYDESNEWFEDPKTGELFELPVGSMKCAACGKAFKHADFDDLNWLGTDREVGFDV